MGEDVCREDASDISCCYSHTDKTQVPFIIISSYVYPNKAKKNVILNNNLQIITLIGISCVHALSKVLLG